MLKCLKHSFNQNKWKVLSDKKSCSLVKLAAFSFFVAHETMHLTTDGDRGPSDPRTWQLGTRSSKGMGHSHAKWVHTAFKKVNKSRTGMVDTTSAGALLWRGGCQQAQNYTPRFSHIYVAKDKWGCTQILRSSSSHLISGWPARTWMLRVFWNGIPVLRLQLPGNGECCRSSGFLIQPLGAHRSWGHTQNQWFQGSPGRHSFGDRILETQARAQGYGKHPILWITLSLPAPNTQCALGFLHRTLTEKNWSHEEHISLTSE